MNLPEHRFWDHVELGDDGVCWPWKLSRLRDGYGRFVEAGQHYVAHRFAFFLVNGWWPLEVRHSCDNKPCCNPAHLLGGTHADNVRDAVERGRLRNRPTARGVNHGMAKLDDEKVRDIRRRYAAGETTGSIALTYGVVHSAVSNICSKKRWKHVESSGEA